MGKVGVGDRGGGGRITQMDRPDLQTNERVICSKVPLVEAMYNSTAVIACVCQAFLKANPICATISVAGSHQEGSVHLQKHSLTRRGEGGRSHESPWGHCTWLYLVVPACSTFQNSESAGCYPERRVAGWYSSIQTLPGYGWADVAGMRTLASFEWCGKPRVGFAKGIQREKGEEVVSRKASKRKRGMGVVY